MKALVALLTTAAESALIKDGAAAGNLAISMRQQLQQANVLQQLAALMATLAADLRTTTTALGALSPDPPKLGQLSGFPGSPDPANITYLHVAMLLHRLQDLWGSQEHTLAANSSAWLCDPSGCAEAAMQLCTAALQHTSSVLQHVIRSGPEVGCRCKAPC
jgi:hypothetical protein